MLVVTESLLGFAGQNCFLVVHPHAKFTTKERSDMHIRIMGSRVSVAVSMGSFTSPTRMVAKPRSQPLMTLPWPRRKENGAPRSRELSNFLPLIKVPV